MFLHIFHTCRSKFRWVLVTFCTKEILYAHRLWRIRGNIGSGHHRREHQWCWAFVRSKGLAIQVMMVTWTSPSLAPRKIRMEWMLPVLQSIQIPSSVSPPFFRWPQLALPTLPPPLNKNPLFNIPKLTFSCSIVVWIRNALCCQPTTYVCRRS